MAEAFARTQLCDGSVITAALGRSCLELRQGGGGGMFRSLVLPIPSAGFGGGTLHLSPTERYAVLSIYSGQCEEGFVLVDTASFAMVGRLGYRYGQSATYGFSMDEEVLVMALPVTSSSWWAPWDDGDVDREADGSATLGFGELTVYRIGPGELSHHAIEVTVPADWQPDRGPWNPELSPSFVTLDRFHLTMPWGRVELRLPLPERVVLPVG